MATGELSLTRDDSHDDGSRSGGALATRNAQTEIAQSRAAQEVQAQMIVAKRFPRDETASLTRIIQACKRRRLAEVAEYAYPKGGQTVTGPSIRMAEVLAQHWGNLDCGVTEVERRNGVSTMMAFCWDLETNTRVQKTWTVSHTRNTRNGSYKLTDEREIYEMTANQGSRRLRACILAVIPRDVQDEALDQVHATLSSGHSEPLIDRVRKMVMAFAEHQVTQEMLEHRLGHQIDVTTEKELLTLRPIYNSLKDGASSREQWFEIEPAKGDKKVSRSKLNRTTEPAPQQQQREPGDESESDGQLFETNATNYDAGH